MIIDLLKRIRFLPIRSLRLHEQTVPRNLERTKQMIQNAEKFTNPIIVEEEHNIVLDGTHRVRAFAELGYSSVLCQLVDYGTPEIRVGTWFPSVFGARFDDVLSVFPEAERTGFEEGKRAIEQGRACFLIVGKGVCGLLGCDGSGVSALIARQQSVVAKLVGRWHVSYIADNVADEFVEKGDVVFYKRPYTKKEVIESALKGKPLPPKSTRHMLPVRVLHSDIPLDWLKLDIEKAQRLLEKELRERLENEEIRYYQESVLVLDDAHFRNI